MLSPFFIILIKQDGEKVRYTDVPNELKDQMEKKRSELLEMVADADDEAMQIYLEQDDIPVDILRAAIRRSTIHRKVRRLNSVFSFFHFFY